VRLFKRIICDALFATKVQPLRQKSRRKLSNRRHRVAYSDRRSRAAAPAFGAALLFAFGDETGLLDGLPLLLAGLWPAVALLLATMAALLFLLLRLIRHSFTPLNLETR
jgi:hypothetical protein